MEKMTKRERVQAALNKEEVDRIPMSIWRHMPDYDQDPVSLAERTIELTTLHDYDFVKMMPFGNYGALDYGLSCKFWCTPTDTVKVKKFAIDDISQYGEIEPLPAIYGSYGKQLQYTRYVKKLLKGNDIPVIQTIFNPLTTLKKIAGPRLSEDLKTCPELIHQALRALTETTINFVKANIDEGVDGFFIATQTSSYDFCTDEEYAEFGTPYDLETIESYNKETWFNVIHIHGDNTMFKLVANYPVNCVNWHDRWVSPSLAEARKLTDKCLLGGLHEKWFIEAKPEEIPGHLKEAVDAAGRRGLMIGPGCVAKLTTPEANYYAARVAVETL